MNKNRILATELQEENNEDILMGQDVTIELMDTLCRLASGARITGKPSSTGTLVLFEDNKDEFEPEKELVLENATYAITYLDGGGACVQASIPKGLEAEFRFFYNYFLDAEEDDTKVIALPLIIEPLENGVLLLFYHVQFMNVVVGSDDNIHVTFIFNTINITNVEETDNLLAQIIEEEEAAIRKEEHLLRIDKAKAEKAKAEQDNGGSIMSL